jgi:glutamyl-tRNA synthetase
LPYLHAAGILADRATMLKITPLIQERLVVLQDAADWVDFFFVDELPPYDLDLLVPKKMALTEIPNILQNAQTILAGLSDFSHTSIETALREGAEALGLKAGQMFQPIRVATCGKMVAPPLFETLEILGQKTVLKRLDQALAHLNGVS